MSDHETRATGFPWPPLIYLSAAAGAIILGSLYPLPWFGRPLDDFLFAVGWLMVAAFTVIAFQALRTLRKAGTSIRADGAATALVTSGPFAISRNPIYLAGTLVVAGLGLITGNPWFVLLAFVASFVTQKLAIEPEEKHLFVRFGKKYRDYQKKVRRWF
ncbi:methyltransferase family protein [Nitratireductor pacificus]|uniref:Isoprenylcysteine carboxyl methyltransferase n=1 Tax=Nitratireductor pacificus pht-3B TaxID=391937 RepID=K2MC57_9HYPH|nr:isoprenylcysteine carboxylmethyltransferase family protein [Nitratireductor pacificus]EKF19716.1 hypothetical protein NA2_07477 [Nitratireductor pacificus pht-3B]